MVAICLEYVEDQADDIFIYCSYEPKAYYFDTFYKVENHFVRRHELNNLEENTYDISIERQKVLLKVGRDNLQLIHEKCIEFNRDMPTEIKLLYDVKQKSLKGKYRYDLVYSNDDELLPMDVFVSWFEEVKESSLFE